MADQTVSMVSPDGKDVADVPADQVEHFKSLGAKVVEAPPPPSFMQKLTDAVGPKPTGNDLPFANAVGPQTRQFMTTPLAHPTGIGAVDGLTSPIGITSLLAGAAPSVGGLAVKAGAGVADAVAPDVVGVFSPRVANLLKLAQRARGAMASAPEAAATASAGAVDPVVAAQPVAPAAGLTAADRAMLTRQGYSPELIERIAAKAAQPPSPPPVGGPARPPVTISPESPMQAPRVDQGAARVGAANGLTKEQVRAQTAPVLGEQPGQASPVFPQKPFETMHDKMLSLPKEGPERGAYVQSAGDPKTMAQLQTILRTFQRNGLAVAGGTAAGLAASQPNTANLESASNAALAAGHWDEAERLIGQSLQSSFPGSPQAGILAAAAAHKARQVIEPLRANPAFQQAPPQKQLQMVQQALRQPGARQSLTSILGT